MNKTLAITSIASILILSSTIPGVMGHGNEDQSFTGPYNLNMGLFPPAGQTFTPTASDLSGVDIFLSSSKEQIRSVTVSILQGSEINSGIELDSITREITIPQLDLLEFQEYHFDFDPPVPLIPGQPYGIKIDTGVQSIGSPGNNGNLYPGGGASQFGSPVSSSLVDIGFKTYFEPLKISVTPEIEQAGVFFGHQVVEVKVSNPDISDTTVAKGEPDVTVNGKILRMAQSNDGNWYGYFAEKTQAQLADQSAIPGGPGTGLDFGYFCSIDSTIPIPFGFFDAVGIALPVTTTVSGSQGTDDPFPDCSGVPTSDNHNNVVQVFPSLNTNTIPTGIGQIGISDERLWPFIQLYPITEEVGVTIQHNTGGIAEFITLDYVEQPSPEELVNYLILQVQSMDISSKTETKLLNHLNKILDNLEDGNPNNDKKICNSLNSFENQVNSLAGKQITVDQAGSLIDSAELAKSFICS